MRRVLLLLLALTGASLRAQGTLDVQACVQDEDDGAPLPGAWVRAREGDGPAAEGKTGPDGCAWLVVPVATLIEGDPEGAAGLRVGRAYPNPAAGAVRLLLVLGEPQAVTWWLYDPLGRLVWSHPAAAFPAGRHVLTIPLDGLPAGRYVYHVVGARRTEGGSFVKGGGGVGSVHAEQAPTAFASSAWLAFEAWRIGYDTLRVEREVAPGGTVALALVKGRGPGRPISDLAGGETYLGFEGGLYPGGANRPPARHDSAGVVRGRAIVLRDLAGDPHPDGRVVLLSIGFSNATEEFCGQDATGGPVCQPWSFAGQAAADPEVAVPELALVDGARGGQAVGVWTEPASPEYDRIRDAVLAPQGLGEAQVQAVWLKVTNPYPTTSLPDEDAEAYRLVEQYGQILRALRARYPNLQQVFLSSRNWGGYATTDLHPEPYAYESGWAVKWTVGAQIAQMDGGGLDPRAGDLDYETAAPWAAWGPYFWAEGLRPRADGLFWAPGDFEDDGTHPAQPAEEKVGARLLGFFKTSPYTRCWFVRGGTCGG